MTTVSHGMDARKVRHIANQMLHLARDTDDVESQGRAQMQRLRGAWSGPDFEEFEREWNSAAPAVRRAADTLRDQSKQLHRDADQQDEASDAKGGGGRDKPGLLERLWKRAQDVVQRVVDLTIRAVTAILDGLAQIMSDWRVAIPLLVADVVSVLRDSWKKFKDGLDDVLARLSKITWLAKAGGIIAKFAKALPILGAVVALWEMRGVLGDLMQGRINPAEFYNKVILGGGAAIAAFFPGVGTVISIALTLEQIRHEHRESVPWLRFIGPLPMLADLLPDETYQLPTPPPIGLVGVPRLPRFP